jgi:hypothetical protein
MINWYRARAKVIRVLPKIERNFLLYYLLCTRDSKVITIPGICWSIGLNKLKIPKSYLAKLLSKEPIVIDSYLIPTCVKLVELKSVNYWSKTYLGDVAVYQDVNEIEF